MIDIECERQTHARTTAIYSSVVSTTTLSGQPIDNQAPTTPANLSVTAGPNQLSLSWSASTDNIGVTAYLTARVSFG